MWLIFHIDLTTQPALEHHNPLHSYTRYVQKVLHLTKKMLCYSREAYINFFSDTYCTVFFQDIFIFIEKRSKDIIVLWHWHRHMGQGCCRPSNLAQSYPEGLSDTWGEENCGSQKEARVVQVQSCKLINIRLYNYFGMSNVWPVIQSLYRSY